MNFDLADYSKLEEWMGERFSVLTLGGVKKRAPGEMRDWLRARQSRGVERVHAAIVGMGGLHDRWIGRPGDFQFLLQAFKTALELGLRYSTTLYVIKSTLRELDELARILDTLGTLPEYKHVRQFYYLGYAAFAEEERIEQSDLHSMPDWARDSLLSSFQPRTERDWQEDYQGQVPGPVPMYLNVELTRDNIDEYEARPCEELFRELEERAVRDVKKLPYHAELATDFTDKRSDRLYERFEVTRLWVDRFLDADAMEFDRSLLHEHVGRHHHPPG